MALPTTGPISFNDVNAELGLTATATLALGASSVRGLAGVASGPISLADLRGKANEIIFTNTVQRVGASIFSLMGSPAAAGNYVFVNQANIYSTATFALRTGVFPAGSTLKIINQNYIRGRGGSPAYVNGPSGNSPVVQGFPGGASILLDMPVSIDNSAGYLWAGGGGGQTASYGFGFGPNYLLGGGGAGQNIGISNREPRYNFNGNNGTLTAGGAAVESSSSSIIWRSGAGGANGIAGSAGYVDPAWYPNYQPATAGGRAVQRNGHAVTWISGNNTTRVKGAVS